MKSRRITRSISKRQSTIIEEEVRSESYFEPSKESTISEAVKIEKKEVDTIVVASPEKGVLASLESLKTEFDKVLQTTAQKVVMSQDHNLKKRFLSQCRV